LHQLGQLAVLVVLLLQGLLQITVLLLHLTDHGITLLEFFFDYFQLLRVREGIFGSDDLFQLVSQSNTFLHVKFDLNFDLLLACAADVPLKSLDFFETLLTLSLQVTDLAFQIYHEVSFVFD